MYVSTADGKLVQGTIVTQEPPSVTPEPKTETPIAPPAPPQLPWPQPAFDSNYQHGKGYRTQAIRPILPGSEPQEPKPPISPAPIFKPLAPPAKPQTARPSYQTHQKREAVQPYGMRKTQKQRSGNRLKETK